MLEKKEPVVYNEQIHPQLCKWMTRAGQTEAEIAAYIGICLTTYHKWQRNHPEFRRAALENRYWVDHLVEDSLLRRALGYEFREVTVVRRPVEGADQPANGEGRSVVVERKTVKKQMAPDVSACIFWLKNRDPENWRDVLKHEHTGKDAVSKKQEKKTVRQVLNDPESIKLANALQRRVAVLASSNGQSPNKTPVHSLPDA